MDHLVFSYTRLEIGQLKKPQLFPLFFGREFRFQNRENQPRCRQGSSDNILCKNTSIMFKFTKYVKMNI